MARKMIDFSTLSTDELKEFKNRYDAYIFDMDETLINRYGKPYEGVEEVLEKIVENGKSIIVFTDQCLVPLKDVAEKLHKILPIIKLENIMSAGRLVARYLMEINFKKKVYVIGTGVISDLKDFGFDVIHDDELKPVTIPELRQTKFEEGVGAVVIAADTSFNHYKLFKASNYLANPEVLLIQTHTPTVVAYEPILPGVGASVAAVKASTGRKDTIATGKGSEYCSRYFKSFGVPVEKCLIVGDGITNDIVAGNISGMDTMLVLTGASSLESVRLAEEQNLEDQIPTYYAHSVGDLIKAFKT